MLSERFWEIQPLSHLGEQLEMFPLLPDTVAGECEVWTRCRCSCCEGGQAGDKGDTRRRRAELRQPRGADTWCLWVKSCLKSTPSVSIYFFFLFPFFGLRHLSHVCHFWTSVITNSNAFNIFSPGLLFFCYHLRGQTPSWFIGSGFINSVSSGLFFVKRRSDQYCSSFLHVTAKLHFDRGQ